MLWYIKKEKLCYIKKEKIIQFLNEHFKDDDEIEVTAYTSYWIPEDLKISVKKLKEKNVIDFTIEYNSKKDKLYVFLMGENGYTEYLIKDKRFRPLIEEVKKEIIAKEV